MAGGVVVGPTRHPSSLARPVLHTCMQHSLECICCVSSHNINFYSFSKKQSVHMVDAAADGARC
jgi:hypothetical protein